jgi:ligand-binding sensor domain-containing protein/tRNA A-37 threonylcarbamoyl transferase component Bud32
MEANFMDNIQPGQNIGPYRIINQVGQGGMATVYKAYHAAMDRYVAVKILPRQLAESAEFSGRFQQEARIIANLEHPHILPVHDYGESDGITYLVMRYLDAGTLKERMQAGRLSLAEVDRLFTQLAEALDYAHSKGVVHRDLKPSNALMDARGELFLSDFGIAKLLESSPQFTGTGAMVGTPAYMSPEQAQGHKVDRRTDIYSLGIILYEMVTGRVPYEAETPLAVILKHLNEPLPLPTTLKPDLAPAIERVLLKALAKNPEDRYGAVSDFLAAWKSAITEVETLRAAPATAEVTTPAAALRAEAGAAPTIPAAPAPAPPTARKGLPIGWIAGGVAVLFLLILAVFAVPRIQRALTPGSEGTPTATLPAEIPTSVSGQLFFDDFESGPRWWGLESNWQIIADGGGHVLAGSGSGFANNRLPGWQDYTLRFRVRLSEGSVLHANVRVSPDKRYFVGLSSQVVSLSKQYGPNDFDHSPGDVSLGIGADWVTVEITVSGGLITIAVDGVEVLRYTDPDPLPEGSISFEATPNNSAQILIDDVAVIGPGAPPGEAAASTAEATTGPVATGEGAWTSWTAANNVYNSTISGDEIIAWGPGGLTFWSRADGSLLRQILPADGLPDAWVTDVLVDEDRGGLWVGTEAGLGFFDGQDWAIYDRTDGLDSDYISALALTSQYLLVGTSYSGEDGGGLLRFDGQRWERVPDFPSTYTEGDQIVEGKVHYNVVALLVTPDDSTVVWVGTDYGLARYDGETWTLYFVEQGLPHNAIRTLAEDDAGALLVGTEGGAARFNGETFEVFEQTRDMSVYGIVQDAEDAYWFAGGGGVARFDPQRADWEVFSQDNGDLPAWTILRAMRDPDTGALYFGSFGGGLIQYDGDDFTPWLVPNTIRPPGMRGIVAAPDGSLWFTEEYGTLTDRFDPATGEWSPVDLPCDYCVPAAFDEAGNLWLGGSEGLWFRPADGGEVIHLTTEQGLPSNEVYAFAFAPDGNVLAGTPAGMAYLKGLEVAAVYNVANSAFASDIIRAIYTAPDGTVWVGTDGGLSHMLSDGTWEHYTSGNPFHEGLNFVSAMLQDEAGGLWVTTFGDGIYYFANGEWQRYYDELPTDGFYMVSAAPDGSVWFGAYYRGALRFKDGEWENFTVEDGLVHSNVNNVYVDAAGAVWFATSGGVTRYVP